MPDELLPLVDLVSEIRKVKHPFDNSGVPGREGMGY
jgi:ATP:corrinoid adenosyltransferase